MAGLPGRTTPVQLDLLRRLGLGSAMVVPLRARDRVLGVLTLVAVDGFTADAVVTAAHLGRRAGLALDNVRLFLAERTAALTLQRSLLPEIPQIPGLDVAAAYIPSGRSAEVGGDWFDVLPLPDGAIGLAVGDVVGHDLRAAAAMGQLRSLLRSYAWEGSSPGQVLGRADELVRGLDIADIATCAYLRWRSTDDGAHVTYARAGHPPPLLRLAGGEVRPLDGGLSTPIGLDGPGRDEATIDVPVGATLVLYTDGLVERRDRGLRDGIAALDRRARRRSPTTPTRRPSGTGWSRPSSAPTRRTTCACSWSGARCPPREQLVACGVRAQRSALHPQLQQVLVGLAHLAPRRQPEDLHDLGAVQVGPDRARAPPARAGAAIRSSRSSYAADSRAALRRFRVVQSDRVSRCSRSSSGPASVT